MKAYLLDTNIWSDWYYGRDYIARNMNKLLKTQGFLNMSYISLGEFSYGWHLDSSFDRKDFEKFLKTIDFKVYRKFDDHTTEIYGQLRAILAKKYACKNKKVKWLEALADPTTSKSLGIQENDLWLTAQAINYGMTLVTADKKMRRIFEVIPQEHLGNENEGFYYDVWDKTQGV
jgi:tRNA(fMet)-specific endonuclease VapC